MAFCHYQDNAGPIAQRLVNDAYEATSEINAPLKRLLSGSGEYKLGTISKSQLVRMKAFLIEAASDVDAILDGQRAEAPLRLEAAE